MNEYQKALDRLKEGFENMFNVLEMEKNNEFYEDVEKLQGLVDIVTPMKLNYEGDDYDEKGKIIYDTAICQSCKKELEIKFCIECDINKSLDEIEKLVDLATPMKPIKNSKLSKFEKLIGIQQDYKCPTCSRVLVTRFYKCCPDCGQKIDWSDKDGK